MKLEVRGTGYGVQGTGYRLQGTGYGVRGTSIPIIAEVFIVSIPLSCLPIVSLEVT
ncbi:hypothetical protein [Paenibacillus odorifer]|uniref:hypothetical protein n=1 Tax=Paenibacillus odorifer TaxID=189426 RepID=UPI0015BAECCD|nr:hypothetical protein [Paenibacillus odorifer]